MSNIIIAKLTCNTLVVGKLTTTCLKSVYSLNPIPKQSPIQNTAPSIEIAFIPFMFPVSTKAVDIPLEQIIVSIQAPDDLKAKYIELTTGITTKI